MLHEVILALNGTSGSVLQQITEMPEFESDVHDSERALLLTILEISENYKFLKSFYDAVPMVGDDPIQLGEDQLMPGMYLRAFCDGLYEGLEPYRHNIVNLEKLILEEPYVSLSVIVSKMDGFDLLVDALEAIVKQIIARQIHGCKILQHVDIHTAPEKTMLAKALTRIKQKCHNVMLKQLSSLMLYGNLLDPYKEFFIQASTMENNGLSTSLSTLDSEILPDAVGFEQMVYMLVIEFLPSYIPLSLANKALFIGNTKVLFSRENQHDTDEIMSHRISLHTQTEKILLTKLQELHSSDKLDVNLLENTITNIRSCVTQHFWTVAKDVADVYGQLKLCRDFYLLGRGEMFVMFLHKASHILQMPVAAHSSRDLNNILQASACTCLANETVLDKFYFNLPSKDSVAAGTTVWSVLKLEFEVTWPLHLLFTPAVINNYNILFHFLLKVKRAELNLHDVWISLIKKKSEQSVSQELQLCNKFMFLIQNLEYYLQLDVLDSQDSSFHSVLMKSSDFEQILQAHNNFLANVISQWFLKPTEVTRQESPTTSSPHPVNVLIMNILELSEEFYNTISEKVDETAVKLDEITEKLDMLLSLLLSFMMDMTNKVYGSHLSKLLLRLDYNMFFSNKPNLTTSVSNLSISI